MRPSVFLRNSGIAPGPAGPLYTGAAVLLVLVLELLALHGKAFEYLGITLQPLQPPGVSNPSLLDTVVAMAINGWLFYAVALALDGASPIRCASHRVCSTRSRRSPCCSRSAGW